MPKGRTALSPAEKAAANPTSVKAAVAAFCYHECFGEGDNNSHSTKAAIRDCGNTQCYLWPHRGWQGATSGLVQKTEKEKEVVKKSPPSIRLDRR